MIKDSYLANVRNLPKDAIIMVVTRSNGHVLSPSRKLLGDYKSGKIDWNMYVERFYKEMDNEICISEMRKIKDMSKDNDVFLVCYEKDRYRCHRSLLVDIINKLG